ncbi:MAG TPA: hypothetical protein VHU19_14680 [Pyrinomonadaceae bacterium]|jgi:hypothetical protein|nr:hypothetical protein [Pyrinomonadaceae bacterium]
MGYEIFTKKTARFGTPAVSLSKEGRIGINSPAAEYFRQNAVEYVLLLWDKEQRKIALRPITKKDSRAYSLGYDKPGKQGGAGFTAKTFFNFIGYESKETKSLPASWNEGEGMLEIEIPAECIKEDKKARLLPLQPAQKAAG